MVIAFANQKGNVAKTTSTAYLAYSLQKLGHSVQLWDLDNEQFDLMEMAEIVNVPCERPAPSNLKQRMAEVKADFHIIECPPRNETALKFGLECADLLIIPTWAQEMVVQGVIRLLNGIRPDIEKKLLITMYSAPYKEEKDDLLAEEGIESFKTVIPLSPAFPKSKKAKMLVENYDKGKRGAQAFMSLAKEVVAWQQSAKQ